MSSLEDLEKKVEDHERRISNLESHSIKSKVEHLIKGKKSLSNYIIELRNKGFFSQSKTGDETHKKLQGVYSCELDRVSMALLRLANAKQLRKASKTIGGKKYKAYVW